MVACRMTEMNFPHLPVLLDEVIENLAIQADGIYVDGTFGRGGHANAILDGLGPNGRLYAFDKDPEAVAYARHFFAQDQRFTIFHGSFAELKAKLDPIGVFDKINGILLDLGVSSPQFDNPERGFSFSRGGKLDMRMDTTRGQDAATWLATVSEEELANVLWVYGEERFSRRIAKAIVEYRAQNPIITTEQLAAIIAKAAPTRQPGKNPATRSFQAIRIAINQELTDLESTLEQVLEGLAVGGRLAAISFHSLEDRIVKQFIHAHEKGIRNKDIPRNLPIKEEPFHSRLRHVGPTIKPSLQELAKNPRSRSAILRIAEKLS